MIQLYGISANILCFYSLLVTCSVHDFLFSHAFNYLCVLNIIQNYSPLFIVSKLSKFRQQSFFHDSFVGPACYEMIQINIALFYLVRIFLHFA